MTGKVSLITLASTPSHPGAPTPRNLLIALVSSLLDQGLQCGGETDISAESSPQSDARNPPKHRPWERRIQGANHHSF